MFTLYIFLLCGVSREYYDNYPYVVVVFLTRKVLKWQTTLGDILISFYTCCIHACMRFLSLSLCLTLCLSFSLLCRYLVWIYWNHASLTLCSETLTAPSLIIHKILQVIDISSPILSYEPFFRLDYLTAKNIIPYHTGPTRQTYTRSFISVTLKGCDEKLFN